MNVVITKIRKIDGLKKGFPLQLTVLLDCPIRPIDRHMEYRPILIFLPSPHSGR
jgi:hypothetical protein